LGERAVDNEDGELREWLEYILEEYFNEIDSNRKGDIIEALLSEVRNPG
jgi:DNA-binding protein Fis